MLKIFLSRYVVNHKVTFKDIIINILSMRYAKYFGGRTSNLIKVLSMYFLIILAYYISLNVFLLKNISLNSIVMNLNVFIAMGSYLIFSLGLVFYSTFRDECAIVKFMPIPLSKYIIVDLLLNITIITIIFISIFIPWISVIDKINIVKYILIIIFILFWVSIIILSPYLILNISCQYINKREYNKKIYFILSFVFVLLFLLYYDIFIKLFLFIGEIFKTILFNIISFNNIIFIFSCLIFVSGIGFYSLFYLLKRNNYIF